MSTEQVEYNLGNYYYEEGVDKLEENDWGNHVVSYPSEEHPNSMFQCLSVGLREKCGAPGDVTTYCINAEIGQSEELALIHSTLGHYIQTRPDLLKSDDPKFVASELIARMHLYAAAHGVQALEGVLITNEDIITDMSRTKAAREAFTKPGEYDPSTPEYVMVLKNDPELKEAYDAAAANIADLDSYDYGCGCYTTSMSYGDTECSVAHTVGMMHMLGAEISVAYEPREGVEEKAFIEKCGHVFHAISNLNHTDDDIIEVANTIFADYGISIAHVETINMYQDIGTYTLSAMQSQLLMKKLEGDKYNEEQVEKITECKVLVFRETSIPDFKAEETV